MKFSYKEKQDLIWSLAKNAERLEMWGRTYLHSQELYEDADMAADALAASLDYSKTMESYERIRALVARISEEA